LFIGYTNAAFVTPKDFVNLDEDVTVVKALNAHNIMPNKVDPMDTKTTSDSVDIDPEPTKEKKSFFSFGKKKEKKDEKPPAQMVSILSLVSQPIGRSA